MADRSPADLIRPSELELHVALWTILRAGEEIEEDGEGAIRGEEQEAEMNEGGNHDGHNRRGSRSRPGPRTSSTPTYRS